jgi:hypothetical protein
MIGYMVQHGYGGCIFSMFQFAILLTTTRIYIIFYKYLYLLGNIKDITNVDSRQNTYIVLHRVRYWCKVRRGDSVVIGAVVVAVVGCIRGTIHS